MNPWRADPAMAEAVTALQAKTGRNYTSLMEQAVTLLLAQRGIEVMRVGLAVDDPAQVEAARVKAAEEKRLREEAAKAAAARKAKEEVFRIRKAWNDNFRARGEVPKNGFAAENEEEEEAERLALEAEKAAKEAFV
jgi:hypothetical protein